MATEGIKPKDTPSVIDTIPTVLVLDHCYNSEGCIEISERSKSVADDPVIEYADKALISRRMFNQKNELTEERLDINSQHILKVLREIVTYYPSHPEKFDNTLKVKSPYMLLYHHWQQLTESMDRAENEPRMHLKSLLKFLDSEIGDDKHQAEKLVESGYINFSLLWTIFRPGDLVLQEDDTCPRLYRFLSGEYGERSKLISSKYYKLQLSYTVYDGLTTGRKQTEVTIMESSIGEASEITSLSIFPLKYYHDQVSVKKQLTDRGNKYLNFKDIRCCGYKGQLKLLHNPPFNFFSGTESDYMGTWQPQTCAGRVIIDEKTFGEDNRRRRYHPEQDRKNVGPRWTKPFWSSTDPLLFPPYIHGFYPSLRQWAKLYIDHIEPACWSENAFDNLILPDAPKRVIRSLVRSHRFPENDARDQNESKGKGLVILLHGAPGTGKTLTAESVAEYTKRILFVISSGALGSNVEQMNRNLTTYLRYAALWKAVVLIDEADVFLEARQSGSSSGSLERNSLVAVFLHHLEYFQGIVFLTSNRVKGFDPAVESRVHFSLQFDPLGAETRQLLWEQMIGRLDSKEIGFQMHDVLEIVRDLPMSGRGISNAVNIIRTMAIEEKSKVSAEHFEAYREITFKGTRTDNRSWICCIQ